MMRFDVSSSCIAVDRAEIKIAHLADESMYLLRRFCGLRISFDLSMGHITAFFREGGILQTGLSRVVIR